MNQEVVDFIADLTEAWQIDACNELLQVVNQSIPDAAGRIQYRKPHFLKNGKYAAAISTAKDTVSFTIFNATGLELPEGLFEGPPERKTVKYRKGQAVDGELLAKLLKQAAESIA